MPTERDLKSKIESQQDEIIRQKQEMTDSIQYASLIQSALLPPLDYLDRLLPQNFILFKPKDIVSGDFYWFHKKKNFMIIVAADCTGHGVPGAFMSILGLSFLNEIVNKIKTVKASSLLNQLRENVMKALRQTGEEEGQKDGMDIALCVIDSQANELQFSGANNPLYLIRNGQLSQTKGDRMPIGIDAIEEKAFFNNKISYNKNDCIYMFSDGFPDQFGGPAGKKYKYKPFKQLLTEIHKKPMSEQKKVLDNEIENWKAFPDFNDQPYEQVDDILVIGIRL